MKAELHIQTEVRHGKTILTDAYQTPPFKLANITEDKSSGVLQLMVMTASPGVLDEDAYDIQLQLQAGSRVQLSSQSYQRLFTMKQGATQTLTVRMEKDSVFKYIPHPTVPQTGAIFESNNTFHLSENAVLLFGEVITAGRQLNGEQFSFTRYRNVTDVWIDRQLVIREKWVMEPGAFNPIVMGQLEGFTHQASLMYINPEANIKDCKKDIFDLMKQMPEACFGVTQTLVNGLVFRMLGTQAEPLFNCLHSIGNRLLPLASSPIIA